MHFSVLPISANALRIPTHSGSHSKSHTHAASSPHAPEKLRPVTSNVTSPADLAARKHIAFGIALESLVVQESDSHCVVITKGRLPFTRPATWPSEYDLTGGLIHRRRATVPLEGDGIGYFLHLLAGDG